MSCEIGPGTSLQGEVVDRAWRPGVSRDGAPAGHGAWETLAPCAVDELASRAPLLREDGRGESRVLRGAH